MKILGCSIKAVTFDIWETLLLENDGDNQKRNITRCMNLAEILREFGVTVTIEQLLSLLRNMSSWLKSTWETNRDLKHIDQLRYIVNIASAGSVELKIEWIDKISSAYVSPLFEIPPYINPDTRKVLQCLRKNRMQLGIICNTGRTPGFAIRQFLNEEGIANDFNFMLFSDEVGIRKPDLRIFNMATNKANVKPYETIHVGDNLKSDIWGAKNAGYKTVYLSSEIGRDMTAESDPASLVSFSRRLGNLKKKEIIPDWTITSLGEIVKIMEDQS